jgi:aspartyl-tRNA(Asn)/glutamyl-tRNA(Gln) amidotransferase subunit A
MLTLIQELGLSALAYLDLHRRRAAYQATYHRFVADGRLDAVLVPVSLADPPRRADPTVLSPATNQENNALRTFAYSYLGFPVITVPAGASKATGLPVGIQLVGAPFTEATLVQIGIDLQAHTDYHQQIPTPLRSAS